MAAATSAEHDQPGAEQPRGDRAGRDRVQRVPAARRVVGVVPASVAEVVVGQVADRVQHDIADEHEDERQHLEAAVGGGEQPAMTADCAEMTRMTLRAA